MIEHPRATLSNWIFPLPSCATHTIITPKCISVAIPACIKHIDVKYVDLTGKAHISHLKIDVPALWLTYKLEKKKYSFYVVNGDKFALLRLANVYENGNICFGDVAYTTNPTSLRQAYNYYWESTFTDDNSPFYDEHRLNCQSISRHLNIAHRIDLAKQDKCICECCIQICYCPCDCLLHLEFTYWLQSYFSRFTNTELYSSNKDLTENALILKNETNRLFIAPKENFPSFALPAKNNKDIVGFVQDHDMTTITVLIDGKSYVLPKADN